jgi:hypothetical protein
MAYVGRFETPKYFAIMLLGLALVIIGAMLINQGIGAVQTLQTGVGIGVLVVGGLFVFVGASQLRLEQALINIVLFGIGIVLLAASGTLLAADWMGATRTIAFTLAGLVLIIVGVQLAVQGWKGYIAR